MLYKVQRILGYEAQYSNFDIGNFGKTTGWWLSLILSFGAGSGYVGGRWRLSSREEPAGRPVQAGL